MWGLQCSNITEWRHYYAAGLVLGEQEITARGKKKRRKANIVCTYSKWQERRKQSSFIVSRQFGQDSFQNGDKLQRQKILQLFLITEQRCKNHHQLQGSQWSSQHCQRNGQPVPRTAGRGVGRKEHCCSGAAWPTSRWVGITPWGHGWCWGQEEGAARGEASTASPDREAGGSCSRYAVSRTQLAGYSCRRIELAYVGGLCLKVSTV